ncbi:lysophospholipid acyltransferase family protein [Zhongshania aquimaris]|uniref:Acyltransferase family protein n=1 Tax=Zhongshania aquimaris TaxID=2857107 RepID=A0ABS6VSM5_9GAMM|nr:lysophospholipid acyltransferase family protein [Zhongshania aquimaris]MBW2941325.1 acyltransferase family protein [Zhongshania aquimaris]
MSMDDGDKIIIETTTLAKDDHKDIDVAEIVADSLAAEGAARQRHTTLYSILRRIFSPTVVGQENIPPTPVLLVGNHALLALDVPLIQSTFLHESGRLVRAMGDRVLFGNPTVRKAMISQGGILGHPEICAKMMEAGKDLLVFPGGSYEVNKPANQRYQLKWKERYGFVKLAAMHGYTILPFATIGPDEFYGRYMESAQWYNSALGKLLIRLGVLSGDGRTDLLPPIPKGVWGTLIPKPERFYMSIGKPIYLREYKGQTLAQNQLEAIRNETSASIETQIRDLLLARAQNAEQEGWLRRLLIR